VSLRALLDGSMQLEAKCFRPTSALCVFNVSRACGRDGGVVVASFYLPVILNREKASSPRSGGGASATDETDGWTAQWDYEQLIALQVR